MTERENAARLHDLDIAADAEKRDALVRLRDRYLEAQKLVSSREPHGNLEWILGARRNPTQDPLGLQPKTVELVALWLQDLAVQLDSRPIDPLAGEPEGSTISLDDPRRAVATNLRDATEKFLAAFRSGLPIDRGSRA
jgi:hypothetical protein